MLGLINYLAKFTPKLSLKSHKTNAISPKGRQRVHLGQDTTRSSSEYQSDHPKPTSACLIQPNQARHPPSRCKQAWAWSSHTSGRQTSGLYIKVPQPNRTELRPDRKRTLCDRVRLQALPSIHPYGQKVTVQSEHKPLETIARKPLARAPPRLQCMLLQLLQKYDPDVIHVPGKSIPVVVDTLSRKFLPADPEDTNMVSDLNAVIHSTPSLGTFPSATERRRSCRTPHRVTPDCRQR